MATLRSHTAVPGADRPAAAIPSTERHDLQHHQHSKDGVFNATYPIAKPPYRNPSEPTRRSLTHLRTTDAPQAWSPYRRFLNAHLVAMISTTAMDVVPTGASPGLAALPPETTASAVPRLGVMHARGFRGQLRADAADGRLRSAARDAGRLKSIVGAIRIPGNSDNDETTGVDGTTSRGSSSPQADFDLYRDLI